MCPTRHCPLSSTKGSDREAGRIRRRPASQARGARPARRGAGRREPVDASRAARHRAGGPARAWDRRRTRAASRPPGCAHGDSSPSSELASSQLLPDWGRGNARRGDVGQRRFGRDPGRPESSARVGAYGRADQHGGLGASRSVATPWSTSRPNPRSVGWPAAATSTRWPCCWPWNAISPAPTPMALAAAVAASADASALTCSTPRPIGAQRFPNCSSARRAPTSRHRRTGSARRSRAP